ncbi:MFS transporter [Ruminiclostridium cellulolyticum]|uniref:Major facilitator superfamily MFS_1 n=1 Tax=Ruminiclostridium cellulolyticum (strain ATCC 35319 / DSM 5812 / JCM 6584 / H10) TaxID=394503 RepID=B8I3Z9_RUMCH|nr:MFS transporter [Ruminiclostridium cellulolyticum]ACL76432.1 major facilitator superfamily MFS_1 [Ruminiclostridium cellulolyticum H10]
MVFKFKRPRIYGNVSDDNYELSRRRFILEGCLSNGVYTLTAGAFFAGYAKFLGASDQIIGLIVAMPLLANILQMFSPIFLEKLTSRKRLIVTTSLCYRSLLGLMIVIPLLTQNTSARLLLLAGMYLTAYLIFSFSNPAGGSWIISLVPERYRGRYFGLRDTFIISSAAVLSLSMGRVLDILKVSGKEFLGFIIVFSLVLVLVVLDIYVLNKIREPKIVPIKQNVNVKSLFTLPLKNKQFRPVIFLNATWSFAAQLALPFFSVYMVTGLELSYTFIMAANILMSVVQASTAKLWGRLADKFSWEVTTIISIGMLGLCHLTWAFVTKEVCYLIIPFIQILAGAGWSGVNMSLFNIQFKHAPQEGRTIFVGFNAAIAGVTGFASALLGAFLVGVLSNVKIDIGITVLNNMLIIFGISGTLVILCAVFFALKFWTKNKKRKNKSEKNFAG